ncbi:hypothetical protein DIPPA_32611 [Diplonema papillatum]|nr:hypothetical protein DIPPA_32611 [Diplonema papillatum]
MATPPMGWQGGLGFSSRLQAARDAKRVSGDDRADGYDAYAAEGAESVLRTRLPAAAVESAARRAEQSHRVSESSKRMIQESVAWVDQPIASLSRSSVASSAPSGGGASPHSTRHPPYKMREDADPSAGSPAPSHTNSNGSTRTFREAVIARAHQFSSSRPPPEAPEPQSAAAISQAIHRSLGSMSMRAGSGPGWEAAGDTRGVQPGRVGGLSPSELSERAASVQQSIQEHLQKLRSRAAASVEAAKAQGLPQQQQQQQQRRYPPPAAAAAGIPQPRPFKSAYEVSPVSRPLTLVVSPERVVLPPEPALADATGAYQSQRQRQYQDAVAKYKAKPFGGVDWAAGATPRAIDADGTESDAESDEIRQSGDECRIEEASESTIDVVQESNQTDFAPSCFFPSRFPSRSGSDAFAFPSSARSSPVEPAPGRVRVDHSPHPAPEAAPAQRPFVLNADTTSEHTPSSRATPVLPPPPPEEAGHAAAESRGGSPVSIHMADPAKSAARQNAAAGNERWQHLQTGAPPPPLEEAGRAAAESRSGSPTSIAVRQNRAAGAERWQHLRTHPGAPQPPLEEAGRAAAESRSGSPISINAADIAVRQTRAAEAERWQRLQAHSAEASRLGLRRPHHDEIDRLLALRGGFEEDEKSVQMCEVGLLLEKKLFLGKLAEIRRYAEARGREVKLVRARSRGAEYDESDLLDAICSVIQSF